MEPRGALAPCNQTPTSRAKQTQRKKIMSNNRAIAQLKKAAETLGQLAETLRTVSASMEPAASEKKVAPAQKAAPKTATAEKKPGRQAAPDVKFKVLKKHLQMGLGEFETEVRAAHPNIPVAQMKKLREELRAAKEAAGIEIKRGPKPKAEVPEEKNPAAKKVVAAPAKKETKKPAVIPPAKKKDAAGFEFFVH